MNRAITQEQYPATEKQQDNQYNKDYLLSPYSKRHSYIL